MSGIAEVGSRIQQIQSRFDQMATRFSAGVGTIGFATALSAARSSAGVGGAADSGTADRVGNALSPSGPTGTDVVTVAKKYLGTPYVFGGNDPATGLDCSSLVQHVFKDLGVDLPRLVRDQRLKGQAIGSMTDAKPGDLLIFDGHEHIGIYLGGNKMLHAPQPGERVKIGNVYETPTSIRRMLPPEELQTAALAASNALLRASALGPANTLAADDPGAAVSALTGAGLSTTSRRASADGGAGGSVEAVLSGVPFGHLFTTAGSRRGVSPALLAAVAKVESNYDPGALSPAGARGLMQITPTTARELGVNPNDPPQAVDGAARLLRQHLHEFGSVPLALAAYNAGGAAVRRYGGIPPYAETKTYVVKVQNALRALGKDAS